MEQKNLGGLIWSVAELLRGDSKQSEYGLVILPFTVLRRFERVWWPGSSAAAVLVTTSPRAPGWPRRCWPGCLRCSASTVA
ncbi:type I restriction-modification system subunit M N-terminal domain-containing protein [endosymbiont of Ridgeia piscesae]|uniref:type I restriction-modification system subunit M N-terminal domain-containing protein n=1 Tax=endosymbiont of Ridgeia piscesae TaxID=54398 RepID=UPI0038CD46BD